MLRPQTRALTIGKYSCLAMSYLYSVGFRGREIDFIEKVSDAIDRGVIKSDCTVYDAEKYLNWFAANEATGKRYKVMKADCFDISEIKEPTPVRFDYNGNSHWVVVENGQIAFNSIAASICVELGKPTMKRIISEV